MSDNDATVGTGSPLDDAPRLRSLAETGLAAAPDPAMDEIAERVRRQIDVPMALVSLVRPDSQLLPGVAGLGEPWASRRCAPLEHSLCHEVVRSARPLVLTDVRASDRATGGLAARELGIVGYAGLPLVDAEGRTLGSLAAIDTEPRTWTNRELDLLDGLAAGCSARLQVLIATHQAERERRHTDEVQAQLRAARDRSQRLLTVSQALARLSDLNDIPATVTDLVSGDLRPTVTSLLLTDGGRALPEIDDPVPALRPGNAAFRLRGPLPAALAAGPGALLLFEDPTDAGPPTVVCAGLGTRDLTGVLLFGWDAPHAVDESERALLLTLAAYVTHAVERIQFLQDRMSVARQLQDAMLTTVPPVPGLRIATRYRAVATDDEVGGDWFDVIDLPDRTGAGRRLVSVMVGDIAGHDIHAASVMGQVRSMGRQAIWERPLGPPSTVIAAMEQACEAVGTGAIGTVLLGHLQPVVENTGLWHMRWTNAGHPPPLIRRADGTTALLPSHDLMFGYPQMRTEPLADHDTLLLPGDTIVLYTDGLMERRNGDLEAGLRALEDAARRLPSDDPEELADALLDAMAVDESEDDVVVLVVHMPADGSTFVRGRRP